MQIARTGGASFGLSFARLRDLAASRSASVIAASMGVALAALGLGAAAHSIHGNPYWLNSTDYGIYYNAGKLVAHGQDPYLFRIPGAEGLTHRYPYPPVFAVFMAGYSQLPAEFGRWAWSAFCAASVTGTVFLLARGFGRRLPWGYTVLLLGIVLASDEVRGHLYHGQAALPLILLFVGGLWLQSRGRPTAAGAAYGLVFVVKPIFGVLLLWLLWRRMYRTAFAATLTSALTTAISLVAVAPSGFAVVRHWIDNSQYYSTGIRVTEPASHSMKSLLLRLFTANHYSEPWVRSDFLYFALSAAIIALIATLFVLGLRGPSRTRGGAGLMIVEACFVLALGEVYGPMTEGGHVIMLLPIVAGIVLLLREKDTGERSIWMAAAGAWCLIAILMLSPISAGHITGPDWNPAHPSGLAVLWTGRLGLLLLLSSALVAFALYRRAQPGALETSTEESLAVAKLAAEPAPSPVGSQ